MKTSIYLLRGGEKKTGYWFLDVYFNYRSRAVAYRNKYHPKLKIIKFVPEEKSNG